MLRYDYYINVLCENKDNIDLACNGKCYLAKQLATSSEDKNPLADKTKPKNFVQEVLFIEHLNVFSIPFQQDFILKTNFYYNNLYLFNNTNSFFHPPSFLLS